MSRSLAVAAALMALAAPASAAAAPALKIVPEKACYSHGQTVNLLGTGFGPLGSASITRDGALVGALDTDSAGAFNGVLKLAQNSGRRTKTYTATDGTDSSLSASDQITVSSVRVGLKPHDGAPGRVMRITARGFTTGKTLWAHVIHKKSKRNLKIGRLKGACGGLTTRRRLLSQNAALGVHRIQFDTFRTYNRRRPVQDSSTIAVRRG